MNLGQLIEVLTDIADSHPEGDDLEVRIAHQPEYPLVFGLINVRRLDAQDSRPEAVWLATSQGHVPGEPPYAPKDAWEEDTSLYEGGF